MIVLDSIIVIDWPLGITALFFFVISWLYAWGLKRFFRYNFYFHRAAIVGILSVVSCTATIVWSLRYGDLLARELVWSLFVVFAAALPGMMWVSGILWTDRQIDKKEIVRLKQKIKKPGTN